jgi:hypothetical protein
MSINQDRPNAEGASLSNKRPRNQMEDVEPKRETATPTGGAKRSNGNEASGNGEGKDGKQSV